MDRMLTPDDFVEQCIAGLRNDFGLDGIAALTRLALVSQRNDPGAWGGAELIHCSDDLMIVDLTLPAYATSAIHEHCTWAVVGILQGCEMDELLMEHDGSLKWASRHELRAGDILVLPPDSIHFISNPLTEPSRGIHVYGKNLASTDRRMWDPETCTPCAMEFALFEQWERTLTARSAAAGFIVPPAFGSNAER